MTLQDDIVRYEADYHARMPARAATGDVAKAIAGRLEREKIIIDRADLPEVTEGHEKGSHYVEGESVVFTSAENARMWLRRDAAVLNFMESRESEAATLARRRDELAQRYFPADSYSQLCNKSVIDDLINTEDRAAAAEAEVARITKEAGR